MKNLTTPLVAAALALATFTAAAQDGAASAPGANTPRIDARQARQEQRIDQGVASGELTRREARRMNRQQAAVDKAELRAKSDGTVTAQERRRLTKAQNATSRHIHRQKHDAQERPASAAKP